LSEHLLGQVGAGHPFLARHLSLGCVSFKVSAIFSHFLSARDGCQARDGCPALTFQSGCSCKNRDTSCEGVYRVRTPVKHCYLSSLR
jgi:hypothetical protein